jgi:hypothetical protein
MKVKGSEYSIIFNCMKQQLGEVINKNDQQLFSNYIQFLKVLFKINKPNDVQILNPNEFYVNAVKSLFILHDTSLEGLCVGLEV